MTDEPDRGLSDDEIARRRDDATLRAINTPPKTLKEFVGKSERAQSQRESRVRKAARLTLTEPPLFRGCAAKSLEAHSGTEPGIQRKMFAKPPHLRNVRSCALRNIMSRWSPDRIPLHFMRPGKRRLSWHCLLRSTSLTISQPHARRALDRTANASVDGKVTTSPTARFFSPRILRR
jgi:hypothetical protein